MECGVKHSRRPGKCDCLNDCGDDPWLVDGRAEPCDYRKWHLAELEQRRQDIALLTAIASRMRDKEAAAALRRILDRFIP